MLAKDPRKKIVIMGAAGRDFHNFLTCYRDDPDTEVVSFTATQIPGIDDRRFPPDLAGPLYPDGIPIVAEDRLPALVREEDIDAVVFAYSDVSHIEVMHRASLVLSLGADFELLGPNRTMLPGAVPIISVCAVRTGVGKSGISRHIFELLRERGLVAVDIRHPMPYRDLSRMAVERYATLEDLDRYGCTIEEREEYEHLIAQGMVVFAGVDYEAILRAAEAEADVIIWDGGNNDMPFVRPDLSIVALDPHRPGHERLFHPGEANFLSADVLVVNKVDSADAKDIGAVLNAAREHNPTATVIQTASRIESADDSLLSGARVLCVEDGPTVTHGGMPYGAAVLAARAAGAAELVNPAPYATGSLRTTFEHYPHLDSALPAMGYSAEQLADLQATITATPADVVAIGTPIDLARLIEIDKPVVRVTYGIEDHGSPRLTDVIDSFIETHGLDGDASNSG